MDQLPRELIDAILHQCLARSSKNTILQLRLVCRVFDRVLKPYACQTLDLDFSRLSKASQFPHPQLDALQTIGYHCKSLYIDLMVLRDDLEVEFLNTVFARVPSMTEFCETMYQKYCLNEKAFTEMEYLAAVEALLFNCSDVDRLRLILPFQLIGRHCNASTMILANTLKAFASRPEEVSAHLHTLVIENVTDIAICNLWVNPVDVRNILKVLERLKHLVMTLRRHETEPYLVGVFGSCLWSLVENAEQLETLCLVGMDHDHCPPRGVKQTKFWELPVADWRARSIPPPSLAILSNLTCLELKRIEIAPQVFSRLAESFGSTLQELYLNEVYLKAEQANNWNVDSKSVLWIGVPNQRPTEDCTWAAMTLRCAAPHLRVCRASFLAYDNYLRDEISVQPDFDLIDPCGLGRSVSQRFVEVVMGIHQPNMPSGDPVEFLPRDSRDDHLIHSLKPRTRALKVTEYDANAYQTAEANTTSKWLKSIDDVFWNSSKYTLDELHYIAETACQGMSELHGRHEDGTAGNSVANEYAANLLNAAGHDGSQ